MTPLIGTSWKMNLTSSQAAAWFDAFLPAVAGIDGSSIFVLPSYPAIWVARHQLTGTGIAWGAQDVHPADAGAHTGDVSAPMLADLGCTFVEVGHSERRREHGETAALVAAKVEAVVRHRMRPILCVGELRRVDEPVAIELVLADLERCLVDIEPDSLDRVVVAYEPVWAIGEGAAAAGSDHVGHVHRAIHEWFVARSSFGAPVIYGGSVDEVAAAQLLAEPGVDGLFVGRRALDPLAFARIVCASGGTR
jgi:triosephosphate isomerase